MIQDGVFCVTRIIVLALWLDLLIKCSILKILIFFVSFFAFYFNHTQLSHYYHPVQTGLLPLGLLINTDLEASINPNEKWYECDRETLGSRSNQQSCHTSTY